jgi:MFS family permease
MGEWLARRLDVDRNNALLLLSNFLWGIGSGLYAAIWPVYLEQLGANPAQIGLSLSVTTAISVLVYVPAAGLVGLLGRKRTMLLGWLMGPASAVVFALAQSWEQLLPGIVLLALVGLCAPAYLSYIATAAGGKDLPRLYALMTAAFSGAAVLSSPLGGRLAEVAPMSWLFGAVGLAYALSALVVAVLPELGPPVAGAPPGLSAPGSPRRRRALWASGTLRGYLALLSERRLMVVLGGQLALVGGANLSQPLAANWLVLAYGYTLGQIGVLGAATAAAAVVWGVLLGRVSSRRGATAALTLGAVLVAGSALALLGAASFAVGVLAYALRGAFAPLRSLASGTLATILLPSAGQAGQGGRARVHGPGQLERGFALYNTLLNATLTASTLLAGLLYERHPALPFAVSAVSVLLVPALALAVRGPSRRVAGAGVGA